MNLWAWLRNLSLLIVYLLVSVDAFSSAPKALSRAQCQAALSAQPVLQARTSQERASVILELFKNGGADFALANDFADKVQSLPPSQQEAWVTSIASVYREIPKLQTTVTQFKFISGRRMLDVALTRIERYDLFFAERIKRGEAPKQIYSEFLARQGALYGTQYSIEEIWPILTYLQSEIKVWSAHSGYGPGRLYLAGSFFNGKASFNETKSPATPASDLDMTLSSPKLENKLDLWQREIQSLWSKTQRGSILAIQDHGIGKVSASFYGNKNPVVIEIGPEAIRLFIYPPAQNIPGRQDRLLTAEPIILNLE